VNHPRTFEIPTTDTLTGLLNEPYFRYILREQALPQAATTEEPLALALLDLDRFLQLNQEHGADCCDVVLKVVAALLRETMPEGAHITRYGGDELAVILPGTRLDDAFTLLDTFRRRLVETTFDTAPCPGVHITCSVGLASYPHDGANDVELLRAADHALYVAKQTGANKVALPIQDDRMITKTSHYTATQLKRLRELADGVSKPEATLLREALDDLLKKYNDQRKQRPA
jgi:diguanylate cyclase (GGDEF)-like protein